VRPRIPPVSAISRCRIRRGQPARIGRDRRCDSAGAGAGASEIGEDELTASAGVEAAACRRVDHFGNEGGFDDMQDAGPARAFVADGPVSVMP